MAQQQDATSGVARVAKIDFGPLHDYLGFYLRRLYDIYGRQFIAQAGDLDVQPREVGALHLIGRNPGLTPSQLSAALSMDGAQITALLNMFDRRGMLERRVSASDGRSRLIYLTQAGEEMLNQVSAFAASFDPAFSRDLLSDVERRQLISLLAKLYARVRQS
ncbi:MarR family transcriptional regulator [Rhizorhabdus dicambivorans]|uniref:MarR family transcriptional regulator n=2 Tax=Rhizorhabdus dicambivorans TaxID=1850238 RepID=A0A2A4FPP0_9SPHN|nr:MarR family transcriptional regulator [Rhizorhabdus dicambivorans]PCE40079.1 MarR family transcriptional regulator [Rhizorhabdus dicambivorans]